MKKQSKDRVMKFAKGGHRPYRPYAQVAMPGAKDTMPAHERVRPLRERNYILDLGRPPTTEELMERNAIRENERNQRALINKIRKEAARDAAKAAALKTAGRVAARAIPIVGGALTAYEVGSYLYDRYKDSKAKTPPRKKPTVEIQQIPDSGAPPTPPAPSRGGGGTGITSGGAMARGMLTSGLPDARRGKVTVEELEEPVGSGMKRGGRVRKRYAGGGAVKSSASKRADGCAMRGKTKGRFV